MTYKTVKSKEIFERAQRGLVGGLCSAVQKGAWQEYPVYMSHGKGSKCYDVDGNSYIDYLLAYGPLINGYAPKPVVEAVKKQIDRATILGGPTESLVEITDKLLEIIPCAEKVSIFFNSGSEANSHAFRLARAYTGKSKILKFEGHYHGWMDEQKVSCEAPDINSLGPRNNPWRVLGAHGQIDPINVMLAPFNDLDIVEKIFIEHGNEIAGVILEPVMCNNEPVFPIKGYLEGLRELCTKYDVVLIFDEVITGFRLALGGAQEYFGVSPDIATFAKAMAGGFPISTVVGREDVVNAGTLHGGTFNGNPVCIAAALSNINTLEKPGVFETLGKHTRALSDGVKQLGKKHGITLCSESAGGIWTMRFGSDQPLVDYRDHFSKTNKEMYMKVAEKSMERGVRLNPWRGRLYVSTAHTDEDIKYTLSVFDEVFAEL